MVYYTIFQVFSDFIRAGMKFNTPNRTITKLRSEYNVNIRTFQKNNALRGFAWFNSIWINENLFKNKKRLMFVFHHEHYHLMHNHKAWVLTMRFIFALLPLALHVLMWYWVLVGMLVAALGIHFITERFEKEANEYAKRMI